MVELTDIAIGNDVATLQGRRGHHVSVVGVQQVFAVADYVKGQDVEGKAVRRRRGEEGCSIGMAESFSFEVVVVSMQEGD